MMSPVGWAKTGLETSIMLRPACRYGIALLPAALPRRIAVPVAIARSVSNIASGNQQPSSSRQASTGLPERPSKTPAPLTELYVRDLFTHTPTSIATLSPSIFGLSPIRTDILQRCVLWQRDQFRQGTHSTKTRGEVQGSTRKIRKQKGTGMARVGDARSPTRRGGGVAHGPKPRDHATQLQVKVRELGLRHAFSAKYAQGLLHVVQSLQLDSPRTQPMRRVLDTFYGPTNRESLSKTEGRKRGAKIRVKLEEAWSCKVEGEEEHTSDKAPDAKASDLAEMETEIPGAEEAGAAEYQTIKSPGYSSVLLVYADVPVPVAEPSSFVNTVTTPQPDGFTPSDNSITLIEPSHRDPSKHWHASFYRNGHRILTNPALREYLHKGLCYGQRKPVVLYPSHFPSKKIRNLMIRQADIVPPQYRHLYRATANLPDVSVLGAREVNVLDLLKYDHVVVETKALDWLEYRLRPV